MDGLVGIEAIRDAAERLRGVALRTPLLHSRYWSEVAGADVYLKAENLQRTGSFKVRGAANMIALLSERERRRGVIAVSAGNHAQGVAVAARTAGIRCTVVMPVTAPLAKVEATRAYGAEVIQEGQNFAEAEAAMEGLAAGRGMTIVPPFDDDRIIAGQGTLGLEIVADVPDLSTVVVPVGGGGLIAGVGTVIRALRPEARVIGVQAAAVPGARDSYRSGRIIRATARHTIADGIAVPEPGERTFAHLQAVVDEIVAVDEESITQAIVLLLERSKLVVEGAGAAGIAALACKAIRPGTGKVVVVLSGGNVDLNLLGRIVDHGLAHAGRYVSLRVVMTDRPGQLARVLDVIARAGANVLDVEHRRSLAQLSFGSVEVDLLLETRNRRHSEEVAAALQDAGYEPDPHFHRLSPMQTFSAGDVRG